MRVCIPTMGENGLDDSVGEHFGRVPTYTIVDLETDKVEVIPNTSHHMGGQGYPPELLVKEGVTVMVCQGLGRRAINMFEEFGISVYIGASGTVRDVITAFKRGRLQKAGMGDGCQSHAFQDRHQHI